MEHVNGRRSPGLARVMSLALLCGLVLAAFVAVGCGSSDSDGSGGTGSSTTAASETTATDGKKVTVGIVVPLAGWWFYADVLRGAQAMKDDLAKDNVELLIGSSPGATVAAFPQYFPAIDAMTARKPDVLIALNADAPTVAPLVRAEKKGIKTVLIDGALPGVAASSVIGTSNREASKQGIAALVEELGGKGTIGYLTNPGPGPVTERIKGANDAITGTDVKVVEEIATKCDTTKSADATVAMVRSHPDIDAIYAPCGAAALGAARGKQLLGAAGKKVKIWGFDGSPPEIEYVKSGQLAGDIAQRPFDAAQLAIKTAVDIARGKTVEPQIDVPFDVVTAANANEF